MDRQPINLDGGNFVREDKDRIEKLISRFGGRLPKEDQDLTELTDLAMPIQTYLTFLEGTDTEYPSRFSFYRYCERKGYGTVGDVVKALKEKDPRINKRLAHRFLKEDSATGNEEDALEAYFKGRR